MQALKSASLKATPLHSSRKTRVRIPILLAAATLALSGCNASQGVNPPSQASTQVFAGRHGVNPYNPISYAQNNTGRGGGGH